MEELIKTVVVISSLEMGISPVTGGFNIQLIDIEEAYKGKEIGGTVVVTITKDNGKEFMFRRDISLLLKSGVSDSALVRLIRNVREQKYSLFNINGMVLRGNIVSYKTDGIKVS